MSGQTEMFDLPLLTRLARLDEALSELHDALQIAQDRYWVLMIWDDDDGERLKYVPLAEFDTREEAVAAMNRNIWRLNRRGQVAGKHLELWQNGRMVCCCTRDGFYFGGILDEDIPF